jgi:hypothetical protein
VSYWDYPPTRSVTTNVEESSRASVLSLDRSAGVPDAVGDIGVRDRGEGEDDRFLEVLEGSNSDESILRAAQRGGGGGGSGGAGAKEIPFRCVTLKLSAD